MTKTEEGIERQTIGLIMSAVLIIVLALSIVWFAIKVDSLQRDVDSLITRVPVFQHMPDATINQANPVSEILYPVLGTVENARIIAIAVKVVYAEVPTVLCQISLDGSNLTASKADMQNNTWYSIRLADPYANPVYSTATHGDRAFLFEGRSVSVSIKCIGGTGTKNLSARVKYAIVP